MIKQTSTVRPTPLNKQPTAMASVSLSSFFTALQGRHFQDAVAAMKDDNAHGPSPVAVVQACESGCLKVIQYCKNVIGGDRGAA